jgi:hypothetical protein
MCQPAAMPKHGFHGRDLKEATPVNGQFVFGNKNLDLHVEQFAAQFGPAGGEAMTVQSNRIQ